MSKSKKIGSKLADSVRQRRANPLGEMARPEVPSSASSLPAIKAAVAAAPPVQTRPQEPSVSHGVLHPSRIWPD